MEKKSYEERQAECGLKVGDKVKILWNEEGTDDFVGRIGKIVGELPCAGFKVLLEEKKKRLVLLPLLRP